MYNEMKKEMTDEIREEDLENVAGGIGALLALGSFAVGCWIGNQINKARGK